MRFLPHWRKATWALVIWTTVFVIWIVAGIASVPVPTVADCGVLDQQTCQAATNIGAGIGVTFLLIVWFIGFLILSLIWFMSRPRMIVYQGRVMKESEARRLSQQEQH